jgi:glutathione peroxidase
MDTVTSVFNLSVKNIDGQEVPMAFFKGKVLLIVNVASRCGFTPQYKGLEALYQRWKDKGLVILGFPCNQFGHQEPGNETDIKSFCSINYDVSFPLFAKIDVNGPHTHPLYQYLKKEARGILGSELIKWNFTKFLIGKTGKVVQRFAPTEKPEAMDKIIAPLVSDLLTSA